MNQQNINMSAVPPALAADIWVYNPNVCCFTPRTKAGHEILEKKTKGLKEQNRLIATKKDDQAILRFLENKAQDLVKVVTRTPLTYDAVGDPT